jgi:hypothetical protein
MNRMSEGSMQIAGQARVNRTANRNRPIGQRPDRPVQFENRFVMTHHQRLGVLKEPMLHDMPGGTLSGRAGNATGGDHHGRAIL